jgi:hypothetical protein
VKQDYKSAALWYRRAMELGCPVCSYELARFYERGLGVGRDPSAAFELYHHDLHFLEAREAIINLLSEKLGETSAFTSMDPTKTANR